MWQPQDRHTIHKRGLQPSQIEAQVTRLRKGTTPLPILRPCRVGDGILTLSGSRVAEYQHVWQEITAKGRVSKFIPASGAATRMFQPLLQYLDDPAGHHETLRDFNQHLAHFPFAPALTQRLHEQGHCLDELRQSQDYKTILQGLLFAPGLNYANLPKALLPFHQYPGETRTALEEHIREGIQFVGDAQGTIRCHVTVSPEHADAVRAHLTQIRRNFEGPHQVLDVTVSIQSPETDTIALTTHDEIVRIDDGTMLFRPGGHGALLKNFNEYRGDIIVLTNIDNVVPDRLKSSVLHWRKALVGYLAVIQQRAFFYLDRLSRAFEPERTVRDCQAFVRHELQDCLPEPFGHWPVDRKAGYLRQRLNRPLRVCGMVPNTGDPGGGPFWVKDRNGTVSRQIVEQAQIDSTIPSQQALFQQSTHFNPVDMVCGVRDFQGHPFDLSQFVDDETAFIANKSYRGAPITVLEWPGLWNGAMAHWNTVFVEIPREAFNPVKTYRDWLHPHHQPLPSATTSLSGEQGSRGDSPFTY